MGHAVFCFSQLSNSIYGNKIFDEGVQRRVINIKDIEAANFDGEMLRWSSNEVAAFICDGSKERELHLGHCYQIVRREAGDCLGH